MLAALRNENPCFYLKFSFFLAQSTKINLQTLICMKTLRFYHSSADFLKTLAESNWNKTDSLVSATKERLLEMQLA